MEYVKLRNSDLNVSRICLGCMGFGEASIGQHSWTIGEEPTREIIRRSLDLGVNFFDTAIAYQLGTSEQFVGRALKDMARREDVVVATKFLPRTEDEIAKGINGRQHVLNNIDSSLKHLGMDYVDLYIYHIWDYKTPAEEILEGMNDAVRTGKARYIGIANAYAYQVAKMNTLAEQRGWAKFISVQNHYNLIMREEEREMFPFCHEENIAMTPYSALASGKLAKRPGETSKRQQEDSFMHFKYDATAEQDNRIVERVVELADRYGVEMTQISLAWLLTKVESPIVGATKLHHIEGAVKSLDVWLADDDIRYLEEPYVPHNLSGVMAVNKPAMSEEPVWVKAAKNK
ncbi:aldo/keto reductase [Proteiniphilum sp. X52]|uniref:aldo/keto reductase n=1 Tax=Proteiniphilum sp. X52 TaxID=2382159 RepID=UPI000F09F491|nr:aldo/keto reductase [Proteiniphilum sp. X52]RNC63441.1 aldo/keto reductase [Proteiniphilum sp. X52]